MLALRLRWIREISQSDLEAEDENGLAISKCVNTFLPSHGLTPTRIPSFEKPLHVWQYFLYVSFVYLTLLILINIFN